VCNLIFGSAALRLIRTRQIAALAAILLCALLAATALRPTTALSGGKWTVLARSGEVLWRSEAGGGDWRALEAGARLPDGSEIRTGADGSAVVARGLDRIELRASTSVVVAARVTGAGVTETDQASGLAIYTVEKRPSGSFAVRTPYVVAAVKGTQFSVDVGESETEVSVSEGRVSVADTRSGESRDVAAGQKARASRERAGVEVEAGSAGPPAESRSGAVDDDAAEEDSNRTGEDDVDDETSEDSGREDSEGRDADEGDADRDGSDRDGSGRDGGDRDGGDRDGGDRDGGGRDGGDRDGGDRDSGSDRDDDDDKD